MKGRERETVRRGYNKIAKVYSEGRDFVKEHGLLEELVGGLPESPLILDLGCGGDLPLANLPGGILVGTDISEAMIALARGRQHEPLLVLNDMSHTCFRNGVFDSVTAFYSIIHVPRDSHARILEEAHGILRPGGTTLLCMGPDEWEGVEEFHGVEMFWSHYGPEESERLVEEAGFTEVRGELLKGDDESHYWITARK